MSAEIRVRSSRRKKGTLRSAALAIEEVVGVKLP